MSILSDNITEDTVTITKKEYDKLKEKRDLLDALEAAGVDNWDGYDYAMEILNKKEV
jgi:phage pi2 protein 07